MPTLQKKPTISFGDAKLRYAGLPRKQRDAIWAALRKLALLDGRRITKFDTDTSKATVDTSFLERIDATLRKAKKPAVAIRPQGPGLQQFLGRPDPAQELRDVAQQAREEFQERARQFGRLPTPEEMERVRRRLGIQQDIRDIRNRSKLLETTAGQASKILNEAAVAIGDFIKPAARFLAKTSPINIALTKTGLLKEETLPDIGSSLVGEIIVSIPRIATGTAILFEPEASKDEKAQGAVDVMFGLLDVLGVGAALKGGKAVLAVRAAAKNEERLAKVFEKAGVEEAARKAKAVSEEIAAMSDGQITKALENSRATQKALPSKVDIPSPTGAKPSTPVRPPIEPQKPGALKLEAPVAVSGAEKVSARGTGVSHESIDRLRSEVGLPERTSGFKSDAELIQEVADRNLVAGALPSVRGAAAAGRVLDGAEQLGVAGALDVKRIEFTALRRQLKEGKSTVETIGRMDGLESEMLEMAAALDDAGSEIGGILRARRFVAQATEGGYEVPDISYRFTRSTGQSPGVRDKGIISGQATRIDDLERQIEGAATRAATDAEYVKRLKAGLKSPRRASQNRIFTDQAYNSAILRLKKGAGVGRGRTRGATTIPSDIADLATIAGWHIEGGIRSLPELASAIRRVAPDAKTGDINIAAQHALDQIARKPRPAARAAKRTIKDLRAEVKAKLGFDDFKEATGAIDELEAILKDPTKGIDEMESAWSALAKMRQKYGQGSSYSFDTLTSGKYGIQTQEVADLRFRLDAAKRDSEKFIAKRRSEIEFDNLSVADKALSRTKDVTREIFVIPVQLRASLDQSYTFRQGAFFTINPRYAGQTKDFFIAQAKSMVSQKNFDLAEFGIRQNKSFDKARRAGLALEGGSFGGTVELFQSKLLGKLAPFRGSERAYTIAGNVQRMGMFDTLVTGMERAGKLLTDEQLKILAEYINSATGRGGTKFTKVLQRVKLLWAPRLVGGRFEILSMQPVWRAAVNGVKTGDFRMMNRMLQDYAAFMGTQTAILTGAAWAGAEVLTDPSDSDFLKIKIGNLRIDTLGGFQQVARFGWSIQNSVRKSASPERQKLFESPADIAQRFARSKLGPVQGEAANWFIFDRKDYIGREVTPGTTVRSLTVQLGIDEYIEDLQNGSDKDKAAAAYILNFFGVGAGQFEKKQRGGRALRPTGPTR